MKSGHTYRACGVPVKRAACSACDAIHASCARGASVRWPGRWSLFVSRMQFTCLGACCAEPAAHQSGAEAWRGVLGGWRVHDERRIGSKLAHYARNACHLVMAAGERARDTVVLKRVLTAAQQVRPHTPVVGFGVWPQSVRGTPAGGCALVHRALGLWDWNMAECLRIRYGQPPCRPATALSRLLSW